MFLKMQCSEFTQVIIISNNHCKTIEEYTKYIMETVHENKDIKELERKLGVDSIELFIQYFRKDYEMIDEMIDYKPWEKLDLLPPLP